MDGFYNHAEWITYVAAWGRSTEEVSLPWKEEAMLHAAAKKAEFEPHPDISIEPDPDLATVIVLNMIKTQYKIIYEQARV